MHEAACKGSATLTGMKSWRLSLKSEILSYGGYSDYLRKSTDITITCLESLAIRCLKSQQNHEILFKYLKSLKSWRRFSSVAYPSAACVQFSMNLESLMVH